MVATPKKSASKTPKKRTQLLSPQSIRASSSSVSAPSIDGVTFRKKPNRRSEDALLSPNATQTSVFGNSNKKSNHPSSLSAKKYVPASPQSIRKLRIQEKPQNTATQSAIESIINNYQNNSFSTLQSPQIEVDNVIHESETEDAAPLSNSRNNKKGTLLFNDSPEKITATDVPETSSTNQSHQEDLTIIDPTITIDQNDSSTTQPSPKSETKTVVPFSETQYVIYSSEQESSTSKKRSREESDIHESETEDEAPPSKTRKSNYEKREPLLPDSPEKPTATATPELISANTHRPKKIALLSAKECVYIKKICEDTLNKTDPTELNNLFPDNDNSIQKYLSLSCDMTQLLNTACVDQTLQNWINFFIKSAKLCTLTNTPESNKLNKRLNQAHNDCISVFKVLKNNEQDHPLIVEFFDMQRSAKEKLQQIRTNPSSNNSEALNEAELLVQALCGQEELAQLQATITASSTNRMQTRSLSNFFGWGDKAKKIEDTATPSLK